MQTYLVICYEEIGPRTPLCTLTHRAPIYYRMTQHRRGIPQPPPIRIEKEHTRNPKDDASLRASCPRTELYAISRDTIHRLSPQDQTTIGCLIKSVLRFMIGQLEITLHPIARKRTVEPHYNYITTTEDAILRYDAATGDIDPHSIDLLNATITDRERDTITVCCVFIASKRHADLAIIWHDGFRRPDTEVCERSHRDKHDHERPTICCQELHRGLCSAHATTLDEFVYKYFDDETIRRSHHREGMYASPMFTRAQKTNAYMNKRKSVSTIRQD